ncbi:MAG: ABC transporter permease, partial [bacterium]
MHFFRQSMLKDLRRHFRDRVALLIYMAIPILIGTVITIATGGSGGVKPVAVLLLSDEDNTFASNLVTGAFSQGELSKLIRVEKVTTADGEARIEAGEGSAFVVIPEGFSSALLKEEPMELHLITNPAQQILPGILEETLGVMVDGTFYLHRIFGDELRRIKGMAEEDVSPTDSDIAAISVEINQTMSQLGGFLSPLALELSTKVEEEETAGSKVSIGLLFLPGIIVMALLLIAGGASEDIWKEKEGGTLRRVASSPPGVFPMLAGKLAAATMLMGTVSSVGLILGTYFYDIPYSGFAPALLWAMFAGVTLF